MSAPRESKKTGLFGITHTDIELQRSGTLDLEQQKITLAAKNFLIYAVRLNKELKEIANEPQGKSAAFTKKIFKGYYFDAYSNADFRPQFFLEEDHEKIQNELTYTKNILEGVLKRFKDESDYDALKYSAALNKINELIKLIESPKETYTPPI